MIQAMNNSVGSPPGTTCSGACACATACEHQRQAYLGRRVTSTRNWAGITPSRSDRRQGNGPPDRFPDPPPLRQSGPSRRSRKGIVCWLARSPVRSGADAAAVGRDCAWAHGSFPPPRPASAASAFSCAASKSTLWASSASSSGRLNWSGDSGSVSRMRTRLRLPKPAPRQATQS